MPTATEIDNTAADYPTTVPALASAILAAGGVMAWDDVRPDLVAPCRAAIEQLAASSRGSYPSRNIGGWKSNEALFDAAPPLRELGEYLRTTFLVNRKPVGWAMINRNGSEHPWHEHPIASLTGVWYVSVGAPVAPTVMLMPPGTKPESVKMLARGAKPGTELDVHPIEARLILFTGNTWHKVPRYEGAEPRITIVFDVRR